MQCLILWGYFLLFLVFLKFLTLKDFLYHLECMILLQKIDHHPKIIIDYDCVEFRLSTHSIGGISELDFKLAEFIQETFNELFI